MNDIPACWCGSLDSEAFGDCYRSCVSCGTLISPRSAPADHYNQVDDGEKGFYGVDYWRQRVPELHGLPNLETRAREDLNERALAWLSWALEVRQPPASVLELGCAHGALVHLLAQAGFDAIGLEMSPTIIAEAEQRFGIRVVRGPLEEADLAQRFDLILAMDVLEHLADPVTTLKSAAEHLAPGGALLLQTPCHRGEGTNWEMLLPDEHLYLFTESSVERLLSAVGLPHRQIRPGYFAHDMWILAATAPLDLPATEPKLPPLVQALLDGEALRRDLMAERSDIDADRQAKEALLTRLRRELAEIEADRQAKDVVIARLSEERAAIDADRTAKDAVIERISRELEAVRADQQARGEVIERLEAIRKAQESELKVLRGEEPS